MRRTNESEAQIPSTTDGVEGILLGSVTAEEMEDKVDSGVVRPDNPRDLLSQDTPGEVLETILATPEKIEVDGVEYTLHPLDLNGMADLRKWSKKKISEETKENLELLDGAPEIVINRVWERAAGQLRDPLTSDAMSTPEAIAYWVLLSLQKGDSSIGEDVCKKILKEHTVKSLLGVLMYINGITEEDAENPQLAAALMERRTRTGR